MSGNNPYAVNGYNPPVSSGSGSNPYAGTNASVNTSNPYGGSVGSGAGRYADPYLQQQNNASSASVNSYGSRERRRRDESPGPGTGSGPGQGYGAGAGASIYAAPTNPAQQIQGRRGYGGLPTPQQDYDRAEYRSERQQQSPAVSPLQQRPVTREREQGEPARERETQWEQPQERRNTDSRSRDRRHAIGFDGAVPAMPSASPASQTSSLQPTSNVPNGNYTNGSNRQYSPRRPARSMDDILRHIQNNWKKMEGDECVPVKVALQLMDPSSLGLADQEADFADTHVDLQKCLKGVVNEHYADFNSAVGTYHKIQAGIRESQSRVRYLKTGLMNVKGGMLTTRPELRGLAERSGELDEMMGVLGQIAELKEISARLEERIGEKRWIGAVDILNGALRSLRKTELEGVGAISDLRSYFANQEQGLSDILTEELHDHLYLKSPYCQDRWKGRKTDGGDKDAKDAMNGGGNAWDRPVYHFLAALDTKKAMSEDASKNPEADTFYYIHMIVEALNKLGHLEEVVGKIAQRLPVELYKVVEKTNNEIDARYPSHLRGLLEKGKKPFMTMQPNDERARVLSDFLWTLYSKFEAIAEGHRLLHEVVSGIVARESMPKPENYTGGFKELWKLYQMEMRSIMHDYLATDIHMTLRSGLTTTTGADVFAKHHRDKNKRMFKLSEMDQKSSGMKAEEEGLDEILKNSVPGLVSKSRAQTGVISAADANGHESTAAGHKLLVEASVFNMTVLLPPSLAFLQHLKDIVPPTSNIPMSTLTSFLDEFLINVFHPQLEETVTELCTQCMIDIEAFLEDAQWSKQSPHPIFKGTVAFMSLIRAFSGMLSSIPQDQMFTQLIITQLLTYYAKCFGFYKTIVSRVAPSASNASVNTLTMKAAAAFAASGDVRDVATDLLRPELDRATQVELTAKEVQLLLAATKTTPLAAYDIISDPKSVHQLSMLYNSMHWLSSSLFQLRRVEAAPARPQSRTVSSAQGQQPRRWTLVTTLKPVTVNTSTIQPIYLPLTSETVIAFDETLSSLRTLAQTALLTLHIDIRCGIIHQLGRTLRGPELPDSPAVSADTSVARDSTNTYPSLDSGLYSFVIPSPPTSASPLILELNNDLCSFDTNTGRYLGDKERQFILVGLDQLVDRYLVVGADHIQVMNAYGAERMRVDAMVMGMVLSGLGPSPKNKSISLPAEAEPTIAAANGMGLGISAAPSTTAEPRTEEQQGPLPSSSRYYSLFLSGPDEIMRFVKQKKAAKESPGYSYDELRTLVELCFSAKLRGDDREEAIRARKKLGDVLLEMGEVMWDS